MFNPKIFISKTPNKPPVFHPTSIVIENTIDVTKSRWDQPIVVPSVLYSKFNIQSPSTSSSRKSKQQTTFPQSLIEYIKRAYEKCSDDHQKRLMENQLRKIINFKKDQMNQISWERQSLPTIPKVQTKKNNVSKFQSNYISMQTKDQQKQTEKPSKAKLKAQKTIQKLQEKLKNKQTEITPQAQVKKFTGFMSQPQPKPLNNLNSKQPPLSTPGLTYSFPAPPPTTSNQMINNSNVSNKFIAFSQKTQNLANKNKKEDQTKNENKKSKNQSKNQNTKNKNQENMKNAKNINVKQNPLLKRFAQFNQLKVEQVKRTVELDDEVSDIPIVGKSTSMEKPYLRITGRADPQTVRPQPVLKKVLHFIIQKYRNGKSYDYVLQQFKSLRQDLTVQHIRNGFTVKVYEQNLKISLFENDNLTFKQYLSNLWELYREGIYDTKKSRDTYISNYLLTLLMQERYKQLEYNLTFLDNDTLDNLQVKSVLKLKKCLRMGNYRAFFDFYNPRKDMTRSLLNQYVQKVRMKYLLMSCKTFGQKINVQVLGQIMNDDQDELQMLISSQGGVIRDGFFYLKESYEKLSQSEIINSKKTLSIDS